MWRYFSTNDNFQTLHKYTAIEFPFAYWTQVPFRTVIIPIQITFSYVQCYIYDLPLHVTFSYRPYDFSIYIFKLI